MTHLKNRYYKSKDPCQVDEVKEVSPHDLVEEEKSHVQNDVVSQPALVCHCEKCARESPKHNVGE